MTVHFLATPATYRTQMQVTIAAHAAGKGSAMPGNLAKYDVFHSLYYHGINYDGDFEMPVIHGTDELPERLIRFSDAKSRRRDDPGAWVVPYEFDVKLRPMWRNAYRYMERMLEHPGIFSWDFSMYRLMPFGLQFWNCFRSRLIGALYERNGGKCIPNVRPSDSRSLRYALDGLPTEATVGMGTHGAIGTPEDRAVFKTYVDEVTKRLRPKNIAVYGDAPEDIFATVLNAGVNVVPYPTNFSSVIPGDQAACP